MQQASHAELELWASGLDAASLDECLPRQIYLRAANKTSWHLLPTCRTTRTVTVVASQDRCLLVC